MKKRITALFAALLLALTLCVPAAASGTCVYDLYGLLTEEECLSLESTAQELTASSGCGVYIVVVDDYGSYGTGDIYNVTIQIYNNASNGFGVGDDRNGILLLISMYSREWSMFVHGEWAEYAFDSYGQAQLESAFLPSFEVDDWYGGFSGYLTACGEYLSLAAQGEPVRASVVSGIATVVAISCLVALLVCMVLKGKMKTVHRKVEAHAYVAAGGLHLVDSYDQYTHTTEERRTVEKKSESHSGGGGSGRSGSF